MTLGRTSSGAIKVKTDGGLRAVNCGCCGGGCSCGSAKPINPPDDPDFIKKLHGDDPSVTPFTRVTATYTINSDYNQSAESLTGTWDPGGGLEIDCYGGDTLKIFNGDSCLFGFCGYCASNIYIASVRIFLTVDGCIYADLYDEIMFDGIRIAAADCPENGGSSYITIQGVAYPTSVQNDSGGLISGTLEITFS